MPCRICGVNNTEISLDLYWCPHCGTLHDHRSLLNDIEPRIPMLAKVAMKLVRPVTYPMGKLLRLVRKRGANNKQKAAQIVMALECPDHRTKDVWIDRIVRILNEYDSIKQSNEELDASSAYDELLGLGAGDYCVATDDTRAKPGSKEAAERLQELKEQREQHMQHSGPSFTRPNAIKEKSEAVRQATEVLDEWEDAKKEQEPYSSTPPDPEPVVDVHAQRYVYGVKCREAADSLAAAAGLITRTTKYVRSDGTCSVSYEEINKLRDAWCNYDEVRRGNDG